METFDEHLDHMLFNCMDNALAELHSNERYTGLKRNQADLRDKLEVVSPESKALTEEFMKAVVAVQAMECSRILLYGLAFPAELRKRFDSSTPEYRAFAEEFM